jgi:hypothetical protein
MKLRIARKVFSQVDEWGNTRNRDATLGRAVRRMNKTATTKADNAFWDELMALVRRQRSNPREDAYLKDYE